MAYSHYSLESFNLYVGTDDEDNDKRVIIQNLSLPDMEEMTQSTHGGGSPFEVEIGMGAFKALTPKFKLAGFDPQTLRQFGIGGRAQYPFIIKGKIRNLNGGRELGLKAVCWGRLTKYAPKEFKRGDSFEQDHEIKELVHYEKYIDGNEMYYYDHFAKPPIWRVNGANANQGDIDFL